MTLQSLYGRDGAWVGAPVWLNPTTTIGTLTPTMDAAEEAVMMIGRMITSDGGSHTIDTSGSSSIGWRTAGVTFANAGTTFKVGIAAVDAAAGPPAQAVNVANVITMGVSKSMTGGGGGVTSNAWQTHVPDAGTKTIANGDLVAICFQMTARAGVDSIPVTVSNIVSGLHSPSVSTFLGAAYANITALPNAFITFADGATGWLGFGTFLFSTASTRTFNSGSAQVEYGQLIKLPYPTKIIGCYGWIHISAAFDMILYSDPLGTPVAERTLSFDPEIRAVTTGRRFAEPFATSYTTTADQLVAVVAKPGASDISIYYKTLAAAGHRVVDAWGTQGYGISRASGAFADANSSLDHYALGLITGAGDDGAGAGGGLIRHPGMSGGISA